MPRRKKGGFHDLDSFRAETGLGADDLSDVDALRVINEDIREQKRIADKEKQQLLEEKRRIETASQTEKQRLENELINTRASKASLERETELERTRRLLNPFSSPSSISDYLAKERLKQEVKDEIARERARELRLKKEEREWNKSMSGWNNETSARSRAKPRSKSRSKTKSRSKSKTKKSKSRR